MKRTVEKVLSIISAVLTVLGVILSFAILAFLNFIKSDPALRSRKNSERRYYYLILRLILQTLRFS